MTAVTLAELLAEAARGEEVVIEGEDGKTFKLVPSEPKKKRGLVGSGKGWFVMREDFDEPLEDFEGV
ncbi:MAG: type II toxin-antitoxin system Phd/YefM family antitoxin [Rubrobacteraceae bacterium]